MGEGVDESVFCVVNKISDAVRISPPRFLGISKGGDKSEADKSRALVIGHAFAEACQSAGGGPDHVVDVSKPQYQKLHQREAL